MTTPIEFFQSQPANTAPSFGDFANFCQSNGLVSPSEEAFYSVITPATAAPVEALQSYLAQRTRPSYNGFLTYCKAYGCQPVSERSYDVAVLRKQKAAARENDSIAARARRSGTRGVGRTVATAAPAPAKPARRVTK